MRRLIGSHQLDLEIGGIASFVAQVTNSLHRHNYYEFCFCLKGRGEHLHGGKRWEVSEGDLFVSEPNVAHEISSYGHQNLEIFFLRASIQYVGLEHETRSLLSDFLDSHAIVAHNPGLIHYVQLLEANSRQQETLLLAFALEIIDHLTLRRSESLVHPNPTEYQKLFHFIETNLKRRILDRELAELLGVSERTLRRKFKESTGVALQTEINHRRMRAGAHRLLAGFSVQEVSTSVGIEDPSQFTRCFQRAFGVTPKKFQLTYSPGSEYQNTRP